MSDKLSDHVPLEVMLRSQTASRKGIDNDPRTAEPKEAATIIANLARIAERIIEPLWDEFGPVAINSGYRSDTLNRALPGATKSQHRKGEAVDLEIPGHSNADVAEWIRQHLAYDQLILEHYKPGIPHSGWVHVSLKGAGNRSEVLTFDGKTWLKGLVA